MVVDSDVLIWHLRRSGPATAWLAGERARGPLHVCATSITEIRWGMRSDERREVERLFESLDIVPVDAPIAARAGDFARRYRRSHAAISLGDYLVAATADLLGTVPATLNVRHFPMFRGLRPAFKVT